MGIIFVVGVCTLVIMFVWGQNDTSDIILTLIWIHFKRNKELQGFIIDRATVNNKIRGISLKGTEVNNSLMFY